MSEDRTKAAKAPTPPPVKRQRILIVDDHPMVRQGLAVILEAEPDLVVCGQTDNVADALRCYEQTHPDVVMVDLGLADFDGLELVRQLKARDPAARVLVVTMQDEKLYAERALRAGALGFVRKHEQPSVIIAAVRRVLSGNAYLSEQAMGRVLNRMVQSHQPAAKTGLEQLTDRELEILRLLGQGLRTREVAERLMLSIKTIETYRDRIKGKLGLKHSNELLRFAVQWALENP
jgi:DNA-binding NarL/FixJ family response regulator